MREYDFVFIYEVKNRELENICLLRYELERRGYSVAFIETWDREFWRSRPLRAKVTICFALYNDETVRYILSMVDGCNKLVNMQWEQIFTNGDAIAAQKGIAQESTTGFFGNAKQACHISWGRNNYEKLTRNYGIPEKNVCVAGHVALDFLRPELEGYYPSRNELLEEYNIPKDKKICLFISSLSYVDLPQEVLNNDSLHKNLNYDLMEYVETSVKTQKTLVKWFEQVLAQRDDCVFIYRPHPAEKESGVIKNAEKNPNFRIIGEKSVKAWILAADNIYTWYSTSVAEIYAAKKSCEILRPVPVAYNADVEIYNHASFITEYESFAQSLDRKMSFPIPKEDFEAYYDMDETQLSYLRVCDFLEEVYANETYNLPEDLNKKDPLRFLKRIYINSVRFLPRRYISKKWYQQILKRIWPHRDVDSYIENYLYNIRMWEKNHSSPDEIAEILDHIRNVISQNDSTKSDTD